MTCRGMLSQEPPLPRLRVSRRPRHGHLDTPPHTTTVLQRHVTKREISPRKTTQHPKTISLSQFYPPPRHTSTHTTQTRTSEDRGLRLSVSGRAGASSRGRNQTSAEAEASGLPAYSWACRLGCPLSKPAARCYLAGLMYGGDPSGSDEQIQVDLARSRSSRVLVP